MDETTALRNLRVDLANLHQQVVELRSVIRNPERVIVFIDNTNLNFTIRKVDSSGKYRICYTKLVNHLVGERFLRQVRIYYSDHDKSSPLSAEETYRRQEREKFYSWLKWQGYWLHLLPLVDRGDGTTKEKGLDAAIVRDMQRLCENQAADTIILVSGDQDYKAMVMESQSHYGMQAEVAFFQEFTAPALTYAASKFINLTEIKDQLRRDRSSTYV